MKYDPQKHHRRSIRLKGHDYTSPGAYFITICTHQRQCLFGEIIDGEMQLNEFGKWVDACWKRLPTHFPHLQLDRFVVMPNHIHGILTLTPNLSEHPPSHGRGAAFGKPSLQLSPISRPNATPGSESPKRSHSTDSVCPNATPGSESPKRSHSTDSVCPNATPGSESPKRSHPADSVCPNATPGSESPKRSHPADSVCPDATPGLGQPFAQPLINESEPGVAFGREMGVNGVNDLPNAAPLRAGSVGAIVLNFKSVTARRTNQMRKMTSVPVWQRNYYEHIIRDDIALANIQRYIDNNPRSWWQDRLHPDNPSKG